MPRYAYVMTPAPQPLFVWSIATLADEAFELNSFANVATTTTTTTTTTTAAAAAALTIGALQGIRLSCLTSIKAV
jgi:hypothetical protein